MRRCQQEKTGPGRATHIAVVAAEGVGFEPTEPLTGFSSFQDRPTDFHLQPSTPVDCRQDRRTLVIPMIESRLVVSASGG